MRNRRIGAALALAGDGVAVGVGDLGGAHFYGSTGNVALAQPIVGMTAAPSGRGYWFVAHDGGIFAFGPDAGYHGSGSGAGRPVIGMAEG